MGLWALAASVSCTSERPVEKAASEQAALLGVRPMLPDVERINVPVDGKEPSRGPSVAALTLVVFSDFECPFCARIVPSLHELTQAYGPRLRIVWRNLPLRLHPHAQLAAEAALEAFAQGGSETFWAMHDLLFAHQGALGEADLKRYAVQLGLEPVQFEAALADHRHAARVQADAELAEQLGVTATPMAFLNGRPAPGALSLTMYKQLLDDELLRVTVPLGQGVKMEELYAALTVQGEPRMRAEAPEPGPSPFDATVYKLPVTEQDPQRGAVGAPVTYVVFGDFECEFTQAALEALAPLEREHGAQLRLVWKNNPMTAIHPHAYDASRLAMEAFAEGGSALFWRASELLFKNRAALERADLARYGEALGLDPSKLTAALEQGTHDAEIERDMTEARAVSFAPTTPMFVVNGRFFKGAQKTAIYERMFEEELPKAEARLRSGVAPERLYEELVKDGKLAPFEVAPGTLAADAKKVHALDVPKDAPRQGAALPKVVIQEFADFECPYCREVEATLKEVLAEDPDLQWVWRDYPLPVHEHARLAAEAAREAQAQGKFWPYHDALFAHQGALSRSDLTGYAKALGLNLAKFNAALDNGRHKAAIDADVAAIEGIGEQVGTPVFLVNGLLIAGAQPKEIFKVAVQRALIRRAAAAASARASTSRAGH